MIELKKTCCTKIIVPGGTLLETVSVVGYSERKEKIQENVCFYREMFWVNNFGLVRGVHIVLVLIFTNKIPHTGDTESFDRCG